MKKLRLLLVDDQEVFRDGLRMLLALQEDFKIVAEASDGAEGVATALRLRPDVVLMDLRMSKVGGVEATRRLRIELPECRVIVLTTFEEDEEVFEALRAGAVGYLLKASPSEKLCEAIRLAARDECFLEPSVAAKVVTEFTRLGQRTSVKSVAALIEPLSIRESEVLRILAEGFSNKEIGVRLNITEGTVKNHMSQILGKLGVLDRTQAALRARDLGLI